MTEIAAGFFARLEFATDAMVSIPFLKDVPRYARHVVERAKCNALPMITQIGCEQQAIDSTLTVDESGDNTSHQDVSLDVSIFHPRREADMRAFFPSSYPIKLTCVLLGRRL
jgi:hypothetical protein